MKLAARGLSSRLSRARNSAVLRVVAGTLFVAAMAAVGDAATPDVAAAQTGWSAPQNVDGSNVLVSVSCASPSFCVAGDNAGDVLTYDGSSWSAPDQISEGGPLNVSCATATFCAA